jgi:hypothetical protein
LEIAPLVTDHLVKTFWGWRDTQLPDGARRSRLADRVGGNARSFPQVETFTARGGRQIVALSTLRY